MLTMNGMYCWLPDAFEQVVADPRQRQIVRRWLAVAAPSTISIDRIALLLFSLRSVFGERASAAARRE